MLTKEASWVSYNSANGICFALKDCKDLNADEPDTQSSHVDCTLCGASGICTGNLQAGTIATDTTECLDLCKAEEGCAWFSYDLSSGK